MAATSSRLFRFFALALAASSAACVTSPVYWPNSVNTPQVMRRGDVEGTMAVSAEGFTQLQASAAISSRLVVIANANYINAGCSACSKRIHHFAELGIGTYSTDVDDKTVSYLAGFGMGSSDWVSRSFTSGPGLANLYRATGDYARGFIQVGQVDRRDNYDVATALRISGVFFSDYNQYSLDSLTVQNSYNTPRTVKGHLWSFYAEPSVRILWHVKSVRLGPMLGLAFPMNAPPAFGHRPAMFHIGLDVGGH